MLPVGLQETDADEVYVFPVSFAQQRLWFLHQLEPQSAAYNISKALRLAGELDVRIFTRTLREIIQRHETLRTTFAMVGGQPQQLISEQPQPVRVPVIDLSELPANQSEREARRLFTTAARRPFNLQHGPLFRVAIVRLSPADCVALFTMHHIVSDAWSVSIFVKEFTSLYCALLAGEASPLEDLPIQYADFAEWQSGYLRGEVLEQQLAYWREQLQGAPPVLELPADRPRPRVQSDNVWVIPIQVEPELVQELKTLSRAHDATLFMTLLAAFYVLLFRHSGQSQICVGTPVAGRTRAETESLIGCFVNTLVLRGDLTGDPPFTELLSHVRETCIGAYAHQDVPFEMLVDELQPVRSLSHSPLFQVMFTLQNAPFETFELPGMETKSSWGEPKTAKFDLRLSLTETVEGLRGVLEYNTDLFNAQTVSQMVEHYQRLLAGIVVDAECRIGSLPLLSESERQQLLVEWNGRAVEYAAVESVVQLFEQQAARTPDAVAVVFEDERLSYGELSSWASGIALRLRELGVGPDVRVAVLMERSPALMAALLGVLQAGGAYVPLDPAYPIERLAFMLDDSGARVLLTDVRHESLLAGRVASVLCVDVVERASAATCPNLKPENLAYVIYTSGSTGQPKGVMVTHGGLSNYLSWATTHYKVHDGCGAVVHSPIGFDLTVTSLFTPLLSGSMVHLLPNDAGVEALADVVRAGRDYSLIKLTPSHLEMLNQLLAPEEIAGRARALIIGGEALRGEVLKVWLQHTDTRLINEYGPTEAVVGCCEYEVPLDAPAGAVPIGRPIPNTRAVVLDAQMGLAPAGVVGELYLGGEGLARGYLNRPDLTAASFVPDVHGQRLYRTGDVARWNAAGLLEYLGRNDQQVKVRGYRIELGEIEAALGQEPAVRECAVVVRERGAGHQQLVAYVVLKDGMAEAAGELRAFLLVKLPEHMVPALFVTLKELPLTANGKVDRRALPVPELSQLAVEAERRAPRNATEETLVGIWAEVLGVAEVGVSDNFFALGGDSILCIQVVARASRVGLRFQPRQMFEHQTVAELAAAITVVESVVGEDVETACEETREVPLTPIQHWFFSQEWERPQHWNQAVLITPREPLEAGALTRAVRALTLRHEALRLRFRHEAGWKQYLLSLAEWQANSAPAVTVVDLGMIGTQQTASLDSVTVAVLEGAAEGVQRSIDLGAGPLLRVVLFELGKEQRLLLVAHHLVMDGVSWRVLLEELQRAYEQAVEEREIELGARGSSFVDWAEQLARYAESAELQAQAGYWETAAAAARKFRLPRYFRQGENREWSQRQVTTRLSVAETRALLQEVPRVYGTQINEVLLTALGRVLSRWTGERRVVVELEGHGREALGGAELELSGAVGWFTSMYPVVLEADWGASGEALKAVKEQLRAIPDKGVSYGVWKYLYTDQKEEQEQKEAKEQGGEVSFNYLGQLDQVLSAVGPFAVAKENAGARRYEGERRSFQLSVVGSVRGGELVMTWKYSSEVQRAATIERVAAEYESALRELVTHCREVEAGALTPSDFPLVSMKQQQLDKIISKLGKREF